MKCLLLIIIWNDNIIFWYCYLYDNDHGNTLPVLAERWEDTFTAWGWSWSWGWSWGWNWAGMVNILFVALPSSTWLTFRRIEEVDLIKEETLKIEQENRNISMEKP